MGRSYNCLKRSQQCLERSQQCLERSQQCLKRSYHCLMRSQQCLERSQQCLERDSTHVWGKSYPWLERSHSGFVTFIKLHQSRQLLVLSQLYCQKFYPSFRQLAHIHMISRFVWIHIVSTLVNRRSYPQYYIRNKHDRY